MSSDDSTDTPRKRTKKKKRAGKKSARARKPAVSDPPPGSPALHAKPSSRWWSLPVGVALVVGVVLGGVGGFFGGQAYRPTRARRPPKPPAYVALDKWSPRKGPEHAKVTIVEFSDFQ